MAEPLSIDGKTADWLIGQLKQLSDFLSFAQRHQISLLLKQAESTFYEEGGLESLDIISEVEQSVAILQVLRNQLIGDTSELGLTRKDSETLRSMNSTIALVIKNTQLLAKTGRVASLQKGLVSYGETLSAKDKVKFLINIKKHIANKVDTEI